MAEENAQGAEDAKPARKPPGLQTILVLTNTLLVLAALGTVVYTKLMYQRPVIVEEAELKKRAEEVKKPATPAESELVAFDQMTVNIAPTAGKAHYATLTVSLECRDGEVASSVKAKKALYIDRVIAALGRRPLADLNTIQGKLMLKTELLKQFNELAGAPGNITGVFFSDFILQ